MLRSIVLSSALACVLTTGCTWVNLSEKGKDVQIGYAGNIQECQMVGTVSAHTRYGARDESKVQEELYNPCAQQCGQHGRDQPGTTPPCPSAANSRFPPIAARV